MRNKLRVMWLADDCELFTENLENLLGEEGLVHGELCTPVLMETMDPLLYDVFVIDASQNTPCWGSNKCSYVSDYLRSVNPNLFVIGTSLMSSMFHRPDSDGYTAYYDERIARTLNPKENLSEKVYRAIKNKGLISGDGKR